MEQLEQRPLTRAALFAADCGDRDLERSLAELRSLAQSAEMEVVLEITQRRDTPDAGNYLGEGRLSEARELCAANEVEVCVFDDELTGTQIKNLEDTLELPVVDRTLLILDIFAARATTNEGKLQTELAALQYRLPRLAGLRDGLSRQGGGGTGGTGARRGAGESKLEYDRRHLRRRIDLIRSKLSAIEQRRAQTRRSRQRHAVPVIALVGYTNVGKSSLLNALCGAQVEARDQLFATLDPTARKATLPSGQQVIFVDTVGFVSRLPHNLVEAFKSTLEEARFADIVLRVADASDPMREAQLRVTAEVLGEIGAADNETAIVYNKCDQIHLAAYDGICVSAKTGEGLDDLLRLLDQKLASRVAQVELLLPYDKLSLLGILRQGGSVQQERYQPEGVRITALADRRSLHLFAPYLLYSGSESDLPD